MNTLIQISDPSLDVDLIQLPDVEQVDVSRVKYKNYVGQLTPYIDIGGEVYHGSNIERFTLSMDSYIPTLSFTVRDPSGSLEMIEEGELVKFFLRSNIESYKSVVGNYRIFSKYQSIDGTTSFSCTINIPEIYTKKSRFWTGGSIAAIADIASSLRLGYATNVFDTSDSMTWIHYGDIKSSIKHIEEYSNLGRNGFLRCYMDQWYNLCTVDISQMVSPKGSFDSIIDGSQSVSNYYNGDIQVDGSEESLLLSDDEYVDGTTRQINSITVWEDTRSTRPDAYRVRYMDKSSNEIKNRIIGDDSGIVKDVWCGVQHSDGNVHSDFHVSKYKNRILTDKMLRSGITVDLQYINPFVYRYMPIPVILTNKNSDYKSMYDVNLSGYYIISKMFIIFDGSRFYNRLEMVKQVE